MTLWRAVLRSVPRRLWETLMCLLAVAAGVASIAMALGLGSLARTTTDDVIAATAADLNVVAEGSLISRDVLPQPEPLKKDHIDALAQIPGIARADAEIRGGQLIAVDGDRVISTGLAPRVTGTLPTLRPYTGDQGIRVLRGNAPSDEGEVAIDSTTFRRANLELGDELRLIHAGPAEEIEARVVGVVGSPGNEGAPFAMFSPSDARDHFLAGKSGFNSVRLGLSQDANTERVKNAVLQTIPSGYELATGQEVADAIRFKLNPGLVIAQLVSWALVAFTVVFTAALISAAVFPWAAHLAGQAARLRRLGASVRQVMLPLLAEALLFGLAGSLLAIPFGRIAAEKVNSIGWQHGISTGSVVPELTGGQVVFCLLSGTAITLIAAWYAILSAQIVRPVPSRLRALGPRIQFNDAAWTSVGLVIVGIGTFFAATGIPGLPAPLAWATGAAVTLIAGAIIASPVLGAVPLAIIGRVTRVITHDVGRLATRNVTRFPSRFARSTTALIAITAVLALFAILGASGRASAEHDIPTKLNGDLFVSSDASGGFSPEVAAEIEEIEEVDEVRSYGVATVLDGSSAVQVMAGEPESFEAMMPFEIAEGRNLQEPDEVLVSQTFASKARVKRGEALTLTVNQERVEMRIVGIYEPGFTVPGIATLRETITSRDITDSDELVAITVSNPAALPTVQPRVAKLIQDNPLLQVQTANLFATSQASVLAVAGEAATALTWPLLLLAVIGISGSLLLSLPERRAEIRALRLVGMQSDRVVLLLGLEALLAGVTGSLLGTLAGTISGWGLRRSLVDHGYTLLRLPWPTLLMLLGLGVLVGALAAIAPVLVARSSLAVRKPFRQPSWWVYPGRHAGERHKDAESADSIADPQT